MAPTQRTAKKWSLRITIVALLLSFWGLAVLQHGFPVRVRVEHELGQLTGNLQFAVMDGASLDEIKRIAKSEPRTLEIVDPVMGTVMDRALVRDRADIVEFLLDLGWNPDRPVVTEETRKCNPLGYAIRYGQAKIAELLLEHGANAEAASWDGIPARELCREYLTGNAQEEFLVLLDKRTDDLH